MIVGTGKIQLRLHATYSLKEKRKIVKSFIAKLQNHFQISVAEVDFQDRHNEALIGFAIVGNDSQFINSRLDKVFNLADSLKLATITDTHLEILHGL